MSEPEKAFPLRQKLVATLFVGSILLVLALVAIPNFIGEPETAPKNTCINNLRLIDGAKQMWSSEHHKSGGEVPTWADLNPYLMRSKKFETNPALSCPKSGTYVIGAVTSPPTCSIPGHALP